MEQFGSSAIFKQIPSPSASGNSSVQVRKKAEHERASLFTLSCAGMSTQQLNAERRRFLFLDNISL